MAKINGWVKNKGIRMVRKAYTEIMSGADGCVWPQEVSSQLPPSLSFFPSL